MDSFIVKIKDPVLAISKAKQFFEQQDIEVDGQSFKGKEWAGKYRVVESGLEITVTDKPFGMMKFMYVPKIKDFFEGV